MHLFAAVIELAFLFVVVSIYWFLVKLVVIGTREKRRAATSGLTRVVKYVLELGAILLLVKILIWIVALIPLSHTVLGAILGLAVLGASAYLIKPWSD